MTDEEKAAAWKAVEEKAAVDWKATAKDVRRLLLTRRPSGQDEPLTRAARQKALSQLYRMASPEHFAAREREEAAWEAIVAHEQQTHGAHSFPVDANGHHLYGMLRQHTWPTFASIYGCKTCGELYQRWRDAVAETDRQPNPLDLLRVAAFEETPA